MSIVTDVYEPTVNESIALEADKSEILNLFHKIKNTINLLDFPKLENSLIASKFIQKHKRSISLLSSEIENYMNDDYFASIIGRFSSGKSTLINAMLGADILPADMDETTSIVTKIKYGVEAKIIVNYNNKQTVSIACNKNSLARYVCKNGEKYSEEIVEVVVYIPAEELKNGTTIIDTPGLGSAFDLNNQIANNFLAKSSAIIMAIDEFGGREYLEIIKKIFQWNYNNYFTIIFAITKKDNIEDEIKAKKSVLSLINEAKSELNNSDIVIPHICLISAKFELIYKQYKNGELSREDVIQQNKKMKLKSENDILALHEESGFDIFYRLLNKTILQSNIRKEQIKQLLIYVNAIVCGIHYELNDYKHYLANYETIEELKSALNEKSYIIRKIEEESNIEVLNLQKKIEETSRIYKNDKLHDLNDNIYCQMVDYIDKNPYEKLSSNKFKKLIQEFENIAIKEIQAFAHNFYEEIDIMSKRLLERIDYIIKKATDDELKKDDSFDAQLGMDFELMKIRKSDIGRTIIISFATIPAASAGGFMFGNMFFPGIGGLVGAVFFGVIGAISNAIVHNNNSHEKKKLTIKESILDFLNDQMRQNRKIITSIADKYFIYCKDINKQLMEILETEKIKRDNIVSSFELEKEKVQDNINAINKDLIKISPYIKAIGLLLAKHTSFEN